MYYGVLACACHVYVHTQPSTRNGIMCVHVCVWICIYNGSVCVRMNEYLCVCVCFRVPNDTGGLLLLSKFPLYSIILMCTQSTQHSRLGHEFSPLMIFSLSALIDSVRNGPDKHEQTTHSCIFISIYVPIK